MEQVQSLIKKLRCPPEVKEKAAEYFRLAELKRTPGLQPSCLAAICVELACRQLGELADKVSEARRQIIEFSFTERISTFQWFTNEILS